jgi:ornithine carbamoyltransferase
MADLRHFLDLSQLPTTSLRAILDDSARMKAQDRHEQFVEKPLDGRLLAMIFDKPSTRTRVSFDVAMRQLGGQTIILNASDMQIGRGETIADTARVLSRYVDAIMIRTTAHDRLAELAEHATIPVINGLTDDTHPCQLMADVMTLEEYKGAIADRRIAWTGPSNNVLTSFIHAAGRFGFRLDIATPPERAPEQAALDWARAEGAEIHLTSDPDAAVAGADCVVTDTWVSMGEDEDQRGHNMLMPYQVNERLMEKAGKSAIFMHCLPAHRGEEVTDAVIDGPQSVVFDEAENRLHAQKGILMWCLESGRTGTDRK